jgi:hypothetical protein
MLSSSPRQQMSQQQQSVSLSDELFLLRKTILTGIIDEAESLINIQSVTNKSFRARTCPKAAMKFEEAQLYQLIKK